LLEKPVTRTYGRSVLAPAWRPREELTDNPTFQAVRVQLQIVRDPAVNIPWFGTAAVATNTLLSGRAGGLRKIGDRSDLS
jgi:hypothetical protein